jgi:hypothetical protein
VASTLALEPLYQHKRGVLERTEPSLVFPGTVKKSLALRRTMPVKILNPSYNQGAV